MEHIYTLSAAAPIYRTYVPLNNQHAGQLLSQHRAMAGVGIYIYLLDCRNCVSCSNGSPIFALCPITRERTGCAPPILAEDSINGAQWSAPQTVGGFYQASNGARGLGGPQVCLSTNGQLSQLRVFASDCLVCPSDRVSHSSNPVSVSSN